MPEKFNKIQVHIDNILLDIKNPRFEEVNNQTDALNTMIEHLEDKILNLARHITENGLNPTEISSVIKTNDNNYIALDGNRRLTTLKILHKPDLISNNFSNLKKKIESLNTDNIPSIIDVLEFNDQNQANIWIKLKHTGQNNGIGTVEWNSLQQARFDNDKYPLTIQLLKYMEQPNILNKSIEKNIHKLKISNLERLLSDPDVRKILSITLNKGQLLFPVHNEQTTKIFNHLLSDSLSENFTVNTIRSKSDRTNYMNRFKDKLKLNEDNTNESKDMKTVTVDDLPKEKQLKLIDNTKIEMPKKRKVNQSFKKPTARVKLPESKGTKERKTLIPKNFNLNINNPKINDIYKELKNIPIDEYPNIIGASFRVFLELSIDYYIEQNKNDLNVRENDKLKNKVEKVKNNINQKLQLDSSVLKDINRAIGSNNNIISIDTLHGYIHSTVAQASSDGLKTTWNNYQCFFELLYKAINDLSVVSNS